MFQSPLGEVVKETGFGIVNLARIISFQSPLGEVVKETISTKPYKANLCVSIPSRGSGKGDTANLIETPSGLIRFQSPLGEVVKETRAVDCLKNRTTSSFNPLSGKW